MSVAAGGGEAQAVPRGDGTLAVSGALDFDTVPDIFERTADWVKKANGPITVDLADVQGADSAGLALLIEWLRLARARDGELTFANVPEQVRSLIRVSGLDRALGVENHD